MLGCCHLQYATKGAKINKEEIKKEMSEGEMKEGEAINQHCVKKITPFPSSPASVPAKITVL